MMNSILRIAAFTVSVLVLSVKKLGFGIVAFAILVANTCNAATVVLSENLQWGATDRNKDGIFEERSEGAGEGFFIGYETGIEIRAALEYDLRVIPSNSTITSALFNVTLFGRSGEDPFEINYYLGDGTLNGADFHSLSHMGGPYSPKTVPVFYTVDATSLFSSSELDYVGFVFRPLP